MSPSSSFTTESPIQATSNASSDVASSEVPTTVLIVGAGVAGLATGLTLSAIGCDVHIYEQEDGDCSSPEAGVLLTEELEAFLNAQKVDVIRLRASGRQVLADDGESIVQDYKEQDFVSWGSLRSAMLQRFPAAHFHAGSKVVRADLSDPSSAVIVLESGERISGNLIIAADGTNSTLRQQLLPKCQPTYAGYLAWRGVVQLDQLSAEVQHLLADKFTMYKGPYLHMHIHPLPAENAGSKASSSSSGDSPHLLAWTWFNNQVEEELPGLLLDEDLAVHKHAVPVGQLNSAVADAVAAAAADALPTPLAELVACSTSSMGVAAISDMVLSGAVISNKLALVGQAGSVIRPHSYSSAQQAIMDATTLAEALRVSKLALDKALPRWERQQVQRSLALCHAAVAAGERMQGFASH